MTSGLSIFITRAPLITQCEKVHDNTIHFILNSTFFDDPQNKMYTNVPFSCISANLSQSSEAAEISDFLEAQSKTGNTIDYLFCVGNQVALGFTTHHPSTEVKPPVPRTLPLIMLPYDPDSYEPYPLDTDEFYRDFMETLQLCAARCKWHECKEIYTLRLLNIPNVISNGNFKKSDSSNDLFRMLRFHHMVKRLHSSPYCNRRALTEHGAASGLVYAYYRTIQNNVASVHRVIRALQPFEPHYKWMTGNLSYYDAINLFEDTNLYVTHKKEGDDDEVTEL